MALFFGKRQYIAQHTRRGKVKRDMRLDNVRGVLIMLVVIGHFLLPLNSRDNELLTGLVYVIYAFHMPCFVMLSGYYSKNMYKEGRYRWGKVIQMIWLYVVYETVVYFTEGLAYGYAAPFPSFLHESGAPWYLLSLSTWYLTIPFFQRFRGKRSALWVTLGMFVAVAFLKYIVNVGPLLSLDRTISFMPFFYVGYFSTQPGLDKYLVSRWKRPIDVAAVCCIFIIMIGSSSFLSGFRLVVYGADYRRYMQDMKGLQWLVTLIWNAVAMCMSLWLIDIMLNRKMFIITELGRNTLPIYFVHRPVRDILEFLGMYDVIDPYSAPQIFALIAFSILLTVILGTEVVSEVFNRLRSVFDPLLEKHNAL